MKTIQTPKLAAKEQERNYDVCIPKVYFPKSRWPSGVEEYIHVHHVKAKNRVNAANMIWNQFGDGYLLAMEPRHSSLPRKVSLFVSGDQNQPPGRQQPILVFNGFGPRDTKPGTLTEGQVLSADELRGMVAPDDLDNVSQWLRKPKEELIFRYAEVPLATFQKQIDEMEQGYVTFPDEGDRTSEIQQALERGGKMYPVFVQADDPAKFIIEGRHRIVAFARLQKPQVPVLFVEG